MKLSFIKHLTTHPILLGIVVGSAVGAAYLVFNGVPEIEYAKESVQLAQVSEEGWNNEPIEPHHSPSQFQLSQGEIPEPLEEDFSEVPEGHETPLAKDVPAMPMVMRPLEGPDPTDAVNEDA